MPSFSAELEKTLHRSLYLADVKRFEFSTLECLLRALCDDVEAIEVLEGCGVNVDSLKQDVDAYISNEMNNYIRDDSKQVEASPTAGFQRVVQRAVIHAQSAGEDEVSSARILIALFAERESVAVSLLQEHKMTRYDAVNFVVHGIRKNAADAESEETPSPIPSSTTFESYFSAFLSFNTLRDVLIYKIDDKEYIKASINAYNRVFRY